MKKLFAVLMLSAALNMAVCRQEVSAMKESGQTMWDLASLSKAPKVYPAPEFKPVGKDAMFYDGIINTPELKALDAKNNKVKAIFYEGVPFKGKPTRVFAYYGVPDVPKGTKIPAMVLIHGGGGTAFEAWVRLWNARGYAAIAMDTCGSVPKGEYGNWDRHEFSGSPGWGGLDQTDWPVQDQWTYHAIADVILAHSFIRSFPQVDTDRIGVTGLSWGGYLTCIVSGVDTRFRFAVPVYGCGFLGTDSAWGSYFGQAGKEIADIWLNKWDPSVYLKHTTMPVLWVNGTNDFAFHMPAWQKSYRITKGPRTLCLRVNMPHAHGGAGENPAEILGIAESFGKDGIGFAKVTKQGRSKNRVWARFESKVQVKQAELNFTKDTGTGPERKWETIPAEIDGSCAIGTLPEGVKSWYMNLIDARGYIVSTEHVVVDAISGK
ncbi:MAG: alpha/beta hydrolase family protein [Armatimonadota bacterium]